MVYYAAVYGGITCAAAAAASGGASACADTLLLEMRLTLRVVLSGELRLLGGHQLDVSLLGTLSLCLLAPRRRSSPLAGRARTS